MFQTFERCGNEPSDVLQMATRKQQKPWALGAALTLAATTCQVG